MKIFKSLGFFIKSFLLWLVLFVITGLGSFIFIEPYAYNFMTNTATVKQASEDTVMIMIDDKSVSYRRWPWPREYYGKILDYLREYSSPKVIGLDGIIHAPDKDNPESDAKFFNSVKKSDNLVVGFETTSDYIYDLGRTKNYNKKFKNKFQTTKVTKKGNFVLNNNKYAGIVEFPQAYFDVNKYMASVKTTADIGTGYLYDVDQIISVDGDYYPYLALQIYMVENKADEIQMYPNKLYIPKTGKIIPVSATEDGMQTKIKYYTTSSDGYSHIHYSASDIIKSYDNLKQGKKPIIDPKEFDNKIVLIGTCAKAKALAEDAHMTPVNDNHPGTDIVATTYDNIKYGDFVKEASPYAVLGIIIGLTLFTIFVTYKFSFTISLTLSILASLIYTICVAYGYSKGYVIPLVTPIAMQVVTSVFGYSYRFILEGRNKEKIKNAMGKYLSQDVMKNVVQNIDEVKLGGKRAVVTVLFSDIRGFTRISEEMSAEEVSNILNEYFSEMEPIITKYGRKLNSLFKDTF
jgi:adenylate cyclase